MTTSDKIKDIPIETIYPETLEVADQSYWKGNEQLDANIALRNKSSLFPRISSTAITLWASNINTTCGFTPILVIIEACITWSVSSWSRAYITSGNQNYINSYSWASSVNYSSTFAWMVDGANDVKWTFTIATDWVNWTPTTATVSADAIITFFE